MPFDLAAVDWRYVAVLAVLVFVSAWVSNLLALGNRGKAAVTAVLFAGLFVFWSYYPHRLPLPTTLTGQPSSGPTPAGHAGRFLEFPGSGDTTTFDLNTVQKMQPGRFTIIGTSIDEPDVKKFRLKALDVVRSYCAFADGKYPAASDLLTLGSPDKSVENIEVKNKFVQWPYPYEGVPGGGVMLACDRPADYTEARNSISNGTRTKYLYDCKRGLYGAFLHQNDDPIKAMTAIPPKGSVALKYYLSACQAVTHEAAYIPNK
jgi:hypothetical protein